MDFIGKKNIMITFSLIIIIIGIGAMVTKGLKYGIDFAGGTTVIIKFKDPISVERLAAVRSILAEKGIKGSPTVYGDLEKEKNKIKLKAESDPELANKIQDAFHVRFDNIRPVDRRIDLNQVKENVILKENLQKMEEEIIVDKIIVHRPFDTINQAAELLQEHGISSEALEKNFITADPAITERRKNINSLDKMSIAEEFSSLVAGNSDRYTQLAKQINSLILDQGGIIDSLETVKEKLQINDALFAKMKETFYVGSFLIEAVNVIGPSVGADYKKKAGYAIFFALLGILAYITWRFQFKFAVGAIVALIHDVLITVGIFSLLEREFTTQIIAALLTIIGYSLNDTIVIFDRIRENLSGIRQKSLPEVINISILQSMTRTLMTSITTLLAVVALFVLGGEVYKDFSFALIIGVFVGTYSSIFIASPVLVMWKDKKK